MSLAENAQTFTNLVQWVKESGGYVNPSLELRHGQEKSISSSSMSSQIGEVRGVYATASIANGDLLIRLPLALALSGEHLELKWRKDRAASPWLRCLARFYQVHGIRDPNGGLNYEPYLASLPSQYETLWQWTEEDVSYLEGTTLGKTVQMEREQTTWQTRYQESVLPYLRHLNIQHQPTEASNIQDDNGSPDLQFFQKACMCLSTRGFHMKAAEEDVENENEATAKLPHTITDLTASNRGYHGPYLLPVIDLLNHCEDEPNKATTLQRDKDTGCFTMFAERDILANEEVLHSYGDKLTAAQILQTFGFVPTEKIKAVLIEEPPGSDTHTTPAVLFRTELVDACQDVMQYYPERLQQTMEQYGIEGEVWKVNKDFHAKRDLSFLPEQLSITPNSSSSCLSDEIVTVCCIQFLPDDLYNELFQKPTLLDESALEDYFLGKLVATAILTAIKQKMASYLPPVSVPGHAHKDGVPLENDKTLLKFMLDLPNKSDAVMRALFGLTIRLEERRGLEELQIEALSLIKCLDDEFKVEDGVESNQYSEPNIKRAKNE